ncbi:proteasome activator complex subunit 4A [Patella vulgata]|uniref:proteasome activator complex subunit 4A n=1 Tax=Patella vulgata TaxID=6465 RepID=UPI0021803E65|nr:proteasome activator complex subunit 4A [Patella vulgata]
MSGVSALLKQQKRKHKMIPVDPYKRSNTTAPPDNKFDPGDRADNSWHQYDASHPVDSEEKWNNAAFVEKTHWGFNCWPKKMMIHAPAPEQPELNRDRKVLSEAEAVIYDNFQNPAFIDKLISFLSLEEQKGRDKFRTKYLALFKGLFRNYGIVMLDIFKAHIERLVMDTSHDKQDCSQRCGMEILGGAIRGAKHWSYTHVKELWDWAAPLLQKTFPNFSIETVDDWGTFYSSISESRDPRKLFQLYELLLQNPFSGEGGAFGDSSRLLIILSGLIQQEWRVPQLLQKLLKIVTPHLAHQYKNVRDQLGSLLANIFLYDYKIYPKSVIRSPQISDFMTLVLPQLEKLKVEAITPNSEDTEVKMEVDNVDSTEEERKHAIRLCKTVLKFLVSSNGRAFTTSSKEVLPLLPIICALDCESKDDDLKVLRQKAFYCLSHALIEIDDIPVVIATMKEAASLQSWHARKSILRYIQNIVFDNFFTVDKPEYKQQIQELLFNLICDEQLEVREMASVTLSGLLHCGFLQLDQDMMGHFEQLRRIKVKKRKLTQALPLDTLIKRHAGVLGLSACVQAYPYDVPEFVPQILMDLSVHVNDPQPIQLTVKKTLSDFRRTHHDNWLDHKQMFTDDQLVVLTDLLISPNYYA